MHENPAPTQHAYDFLVAAITGGDWKVGSRLPPLRTLSNMAKVSTAAMWKAVKMLREKGLVYGKKGGTVYFGRKQLSRSIGIEAPATKLWQKKQTRIERDILNGRFRNDTLPTTSELCAQYDISYATLKKILNSLVAEEIIVAYKKTYRIPRMAGGRYRPSVLLVTHERPMEKQDVFGLRRQMVLNGLEALCAEHGMMLEVASCDFFSPTLVSKVQSFLKQSSRTHIGSVFDILIHPESGVMQRLYDVIHLLTLNSKPLAVVDESDLFVVPDYLSAAGNSQVFKIAGQHAGQRVAQLLLQLGHRRVAYISLYHGNEWSRLRLAGLTAYFLKAGLADGVIPFTAQENWAYLKVLNLLQREKLETILTSGPFPEIGGILTKLDGIFKELPDMHVETSSKIQSNVQLLLSLTKQKINPAMFAHIRETIIDQLVALSVDISLKPLIDKALADTSITALVFGSDVLALATLRVLQKTKKRVPEDLSVVGFDNAPEAVRRKLTTIDFNFPAMVHQAYSFIALSHRSTRRAGSRLPVEIDPLLIVRGTTARAPAHAAPRAE